tara:strand:- start:2111 stop:2707 length:597 start_codon:yes stop_codon:yes gene_type:complete
MACSIDAIKIDLLDKASRKLTSNVKGLKEVKPGVYEIGRQGKSLNAAYDKAQKAREDVRKWAEKTYGDKFQWNWSTLDTTHPNKISVKVQVPLAVEQLLRVKLGLTSVEAANEIEPFIEDAKKFSKDPALSHQEMMSDTKFYEDFTEIIPTLASEEYVSDTENIDEVVEFEYDKTQETNNILTDAELFRLLNDDLNIC